MTGGAACVVQKAGDHWSLRVEPLGHAACGVIGAVAEVGCDAPALGILARREADTRWRAGRCGDVERLEAQALGGEAVDVRGLGILVAEARKVSPAHVVDEDHDDVRSASGSGLGE